jgi:hypothetical protein
MAFSNTPGSLGMAFNGGKMDETFISFTPVAEMVMFDPLIVTKSTVRGWL